ncbi:tRNA (5-methylaminomethyl-2-thiouridine)(34)-methyltransferase MnmD [Maribacter sp. 2-571]|uniref:tRNA (5-methylaminomethyl-2-thiouridine)(34)-methyltransferase MnmD n=1 Tax=Maribacter sp. 2-571 TaxID=3417569 RepID=UPI003D330336
MNRRIITTGDGSKTIHLEEWDEQYHSKHGAIQEAYHVFIKNGLFELETENVAILEIGFGTGLNALITYSEAEKISKSIRYTGVEAYPVVPEEWGQMGYVSQLEGQNLQKVFEQLHTSKWETPTPIGERFLLLKQQKYFKDVSETNLFNLIYFDAFGARVQPELWTEQIFGQMFRALKKGGILVTYSAKGSVRRAMQSVGFVVERLPGPPGKREMLRARKPIE